MKEHEKRIREALANAGEFSDNDRSSSEWVNTADLDAAIDAARTNQENV